MWNLALPHPPRTSQRTPKRTSQRTSKASGLWTLLLACYLLSLPQPASARSPHAEPPTRSSPMPREAQATPAPHKPRAARAAQSSELAHLLRATRAGQPSELAHTPHAARAVQSPTPEPISAHEIEAHLRFLADDLLQGRGLGTDGLELANLYLASTFQQYGLEPPFEGSFQQPFRLQGSTPDPNSTLTFQGPSGELKPAYLTEFVTFSNHRDLPETVEAELVYAGYLIEDPARGWDDLKGADLEGKFLLVEVNEPLAGPDTPYDPEEMGYTGRWTYKYEQAEKAGALGVLLIHNDVRATYGWGVVRNSWSLEGFTIPEESLGCPVEGWVTEEVARAAVALGGADYGELFDSAQRPDFRPRPLGITVAVSMSPEFREVETANVGGLLPATGPTDVTEGTDADGPRGPSEGPWAPTLVVTAHQDHIGLAPDGGVYNGLVDNASAVSAMLSLARYFSEQPERPMNLLFVAVSAEEQGLWGSRYLVGNPPLPLASIWANLNLELTNVWGRTHDVYAIGANRSSLEPIARRAAEELGLEYIPEQDRKNGFFFRSDQFSFARAGIPGLWPHEGLRSVGANPDQITERRQEYRSRHYHQTSDSLDGLWDQWDLEGTVQIAEWSARILELLSQTEDRPRFSKGSMFAR